MKKSVAIVYNTSEYAFKFKKNLILALKQNNYDVMVIAPFDRYSDRLRELGVTYVRLDMDRKGQNPLAELLLIVQFVKVFKRAAPDVILNFTIKPNIYGAIAAALVSRPTISNVTGLGTLFIKSGFALSLVKILYKVAFKFPNKVFFQNIDDKCLFEDLKLVRSEKAELIPGSGVDIDRFSPGEPSETGSKVRFLYVGRILKDKGVMEFVGAAQLLLAKHSNIEFQLLGGLDEDNPTAITHDQVAQWQSDGIINYLGYIEDVGPFLNSADIVVLPSYREGMPRTILEASASGKPVIATDVPGCRDAVVDGVTGYLCKVKDTASLADAMERMLIDGPDKRREMGVNGRQRMLEVFDERIVTRKYIETITAILNP